MTQSSKIRQALKTLGILGEYVSFQTPEEALKKKYRELTLKYHPDKCTGPACPDFIAIQSSYDTLKALSPKEIIDAINDNPITRLMSCVKNALQNTKFPSNLTEEQLQSIIKAKNIYCPNPEDATPQPTRTYTPQQAKPETEPKSNQEVLMQCLTKHLPNSEFPNNLTEDQLIKILGIKNIPCPGYYNNSQTAKPSASKTTPEPATEPMSNEEVLMQCLKKHFPNSAFASNLNEEQLVQILDIKHIPCPGYDREAAEKDKLYQRSQDDMLNSHEDSIDPNYVPLSGVDE